MEKNVVQIKIGMAINVNASVKSIIYLKKIIFGTCYIYSQKC